MNDTEDNEHSFYLDFTLVTEEIWVILCALINISANGLILYCLLKLRLKGTTYLTIFNIAVLDVIQLTTCPVMYKMFSKTHELVEEFEAHSVFLNIFYSSMYGIVLCHLLLMFRIYLPVIETAFMYIIIGIWTILIGIFIGGYLTYELYYERGLFNKVYVTLFIILFLAMLTDHIISTLSLTSEKSQDHKVSIVLTLILLNVRTCLTAVFFPIAVIATLSTAKIFMNVLIGIGEFNSILNMLTLAYMDTNFKNVLYETLKLKTIVSDNNVNFVNVPDETVKILEDE